AYGISEAGSDWSTFRLLNLATGEEVDDARIQTKFSQAEWLPDHRSYIIPILIMRVSRTALRLPRWQDLSCGCIASATRKIMTR
ncbi:MAG TPA: hypothetical protein VFP81_05495, partial [Propionibacteriaceae bacterium]|nr:hypothetical protein [Propionibacteriaceae bacterium]